LPGVSEWHVQAEEVPQPSLVATAHGPFGHIVTAESHPGDDSIYREVCALEPQEQHVYMVTLAL
jgi:hypothetical protein